MRLIKRQFGIDVVKAFAIVGVVLIHTCISGYSYDVGSFNWAASLFWGSISRASVPLFFMCSGALLLAPSHNLSIRKLFSKNIMRLCAALFFWAALYKCFHLWGSGNLTAAGVWQAFKELLLFRHEPHLYFLHIMLLVYLLLPVVRVYINAATDSQIRYFLAIWFLLGILYPTVKPFWPFTLLKGIPLQWQINMTYAAIGYEVLGYYLARHPIKGKVYTYCMGALGFGSVFVGTWFMSARENQLYEHFLEGMTLGVCLLAVGVFGGLMRTNGTKCPWMIGKIIQFLSKASFCIYLVHGFFTQIFGLVGLSVKAFPCMVSIPALVLLNICLCSLIYMVLLKIPFLREWVI